MSTEQSAVQAKESAGAGGGTQVTGQRAGLADIGWSCGLLGVFAAALWLAKHALPHDLHISILGHELATIGRAPPRPAIVDILALSFAPVVFVIELIASGWRQSSLRKLFRAMTPSAGADLFMFLTVQLGVVSLMTKIFTLGVTAFAGLWLNHLLDRWLHVKLSLFPNSFIMQFCVFYIVAGFLDYWNHRIQHSYFFWPLHRFHHAADEFCVLTSDRVHPADGFWNFLTMAVAVALLGTPPGVVIAFGLFNRLLQYVRHAKVDWDFGWVGRYLIQSPVHHRLHHGLEAQFQHCHFGIMPLWDRLFGTWREPPGRDFEIGVDYAYRNGGGTFADLVRDYCDVWVGVGAAAKKAVARGVDPERLR